MLCSGEYQALTIAGFVIHLNYMNKIIIKDLAYRAKDKPLNNLHISNTQALTHLFAVVCQAYLETIAPANLSYSQHLQDVYLFGVFQPNSYIESYKQ